MVRGSILWLCLHCFFPPHLTQPILYSPHSSPLDRLTPFASSASFQNISPSSKNTSSSVPNFWSSPANRLLYQLLQTSPITLGSLCRALLSRVGFWIQLDGRSLSHPAPEFHWTYGWESGLQINTLANAMGDPPQLCWHQLREPNFATQVVSVGRVFNDAWPTSFPKQCNCWKKS